MSKEEIEEAKAHLKWLLDNGILPSEDEPHIEIILSYIEQLESDRQKLIEKLEKDNKQDKESVQYYEKVRRDCQENSDEYKKIYQNVINKLNEKRTLRKEILEILKGENQ